MFKRVLCIAVAVVMVLALVACGGSSSSSSADKTAAPSASTAPTASTAAPTVNPADLKGDISFWHWNQAESTKIMDMFKKVYPNVKVNFSLIPDKDQNFVNKLTANLRSGSGVPDVFALESAFVRRIVEMDGALADLTAKVEPLKSDIVPYTLEIGTDPSGKIKALSHQVAPGFIEYKKAAAKKYLGTDDPAAVQDMVSTPEKILETAAKVKTASNGKVCLFPGWEEPYKMFLGARDTGWVKDGKLVIDPQIDTFIDYAKKLHDAGGEGGLQQWNPPWAASQGSDEIAIMYASVGWFNGSIIPTNDKKANDGGRWGVVKGPLTYAWGGTWYGIYDKSDKQDLAWEFVKFHTTNKDHLREWAKSGDLVSSLSVLSEGAGVDKVCGVDLGKFTSTYISDIKARYTSLDSSVEASFTNVMRSFLAGKLATKEDMIKEFKKQVKTNNKDLTVD